MRLDGAGLPCTRRVPVILREWWIWLKSKLETRRDLRKKGEQEMETKKHQKIQRSTDGSVAHSSCRNSRRLGDFAETVIETFLDAKWSTFSYYRLIPLVP